MCVLLHVGTHPTHHRVNIGAGERHVVEERLGEGAVAAAPIERDVAGLRRIDDERADAGIDAGETFGGTERARPSGRRKTFRERVVAARVEDHDARAREAGEVGEHRVERHELAAHVILGLGLGIDRREIVFAADLQGVAQRNR